jgi:hypothetical protein
MVEKRFEELKGALLRTGVARRKVQRAVLEIESHFQRLLDEERHRGAADADARIAAHRRLGTNEMLLLHYAARPELHAWPRRWPAFWFAILPLITYLAVSAVTLAGVLMAADQMSPYLHKIRIAPQTTHGIDLTAHIMLLWIFPAAVIITFAVLSLRRRVALRWPIVGAVLISALASLINVSVRFTGGPTPGELGAGIGVSLESLPGQVTRAAILASLAVVPLWLARRRAHDYNVS